MRALPGVSVAQSDSQARPDAVLTGPDARNKVCLYRVLFPRASPAIHSEVGPATPWAYNSDATARIARS